MTTARSLIYPVLGTLLVLIGLVLLPLPLPLGLPCLTAGAVLLLGMVVHG